MGIAKLYKEGCNDANTYDDRSTGQLLSYLLGVCDLCVLESLGCIGSNHRDFRYAPLSLNF